MANEVQIKLFVTGAQESVSGVDKLTQAFNRVSTAAAETAARSAAAFNSSISTAAKAEADKINQAFEGLGSKSGGAVSESMRDTARAVGGVSDQVGVLASKVALMGRLGAALAIAPQVLSSVRDFSASLIEAQISSQKLMGSLSYSAGSASGAAAELEYLRQVTNRLGVDFTTASAAYAKFAAASKGSGISGENVKTVFEGISAAAVKLGLSADETGGALLALSQMASKGTVQAEELRGQLGERLPGAFNLAAKAMGVTTRELGKMMEQGQLMASDFLPKFGQALKDEFQAPMTSLVQEMNRFNSAWDQWKQALANSDGGSMKFLTNGLNESAAAMRSLGHEAGIVQKLLIGIGGFQAGAIGSSFFDKGKAQSELMAQLSMVRNGRQSLEGRHLNYLEQEQLADLKRQESAIRSSLTSMATRGVEFKAPDLKGDMLAQQQKADDALKAYMKDGKHLTKNEKLTKDLEEENKAFAAGVAGFTENSKEYLSAYKSHQARVKELKEKAVEGTTKNDFAQQIDAQINILKEKSKTEIDIIKDKVAERVTTEKDGIEQIKAAQLGAAKDEIDLLSKKYGGTKDTGERAKIAADIAKAGLAATRAVADADKSLSHLADTELKRYQEYMKGIGDETADLIKKAKAAEDENSTIGATVEQLAALKAARYDEMIAKKEAALAQAASNEGSEAEVFLIKQQIEALGRLKSAEVARPKLQEQAAEWKKFSDDIERSLTDALMRGFESGNSFGENFVKTLGNTLKTAALKIVVQAIVSPVMSGVQSIGQSMGLSPGLSGATGSAGTASNLLSVGNSAYNLYNGGGSLYSNFATSAAGQWLGLSTAAGAGLTVGTGLGTGVLAGSTLTGGATTAIGGAAGGAGLTLGGGATGISVGTGLGSGVLSGSSLAGTATGTAATIAEGTAVAAGGSAAAAGGLTTLGMAVPYIGLAIAIAAALSSKKKKKEPEIPANIYDTTFGMDDNKPFLISNGSKNISDMAGANAASAGYLAETNKILKTLGIKQTFSEKFINHTGDSGSYGFAMSVPGYSFAESGVADKNDPKVAAKAIDEAFTRAVIGLMGSDAVSEKLKKQWADLTQLGYDARSAFDAMDAFAKFQSSLNLINKGAGEAAAELAKAAGGLDALTSQVADYYNNYFSAEEQRAKSMEDLKARFTDVGLVMPETRAEFRKMVESLDLTTASGKETFNSLMSLEGAFAGLVDAATSGVANMVKATQEAAGKQVSDAYSALQRAVSAERSQIDSAYTAQSERLAMAADAAREARSAIGSLADTLKNASGTIVADTDALTEARRRSAMQSLGQAISAADAGQNLAPLSDSISAAISELQKPSEQLYATFSDYARAQGQANGAIVKLQQSAAAQKSVADMTLKAIEDATKSATEQHKADLGRLDGVLSSAQAQIDALNGVNTSVLSVADAVKALGQSITSAMTVNAVANHTALQPVPAAVTGTIATGANSISGTSNTSIMGQVASMYEQVAGRTADPGGLLYWAQQAQNAGGVANVLDDFRTQLVMHGEIPKFRTGTDYVQKDMLAEIHQGEIIIDPQSSAVLRKYGIGVQAMGGTGGKTDEEVRALREDVRSQAAAMAGLLSRISKVVERWEADGMPETRVVA